jgi:DNA-binding transcriptional ArsR family regulator
MNADSEHPSRTSNSSRASGSQDADACQVQCVHEDAVARAREGMLPEREVADLAALFKVLGEPTRVRILRGLSGGELCVCDLSALLGMTASAVSHQLRVLRSAKLVRPRKDGKIVYYALDDDHVAGLLRDGLEHVRHG